MSAIFLSDVHLDDPASVKTKLVVRFLQEIASRFDKIFLLGDIFDVWPATTPYLLSRFSPVLDTFRKLVADGHELHYFEGNHDFHLGEAFSEGIGMRVYPDASEFRWGGKRVYVAHGDLGNPRELGYRAFRYLTRRDWARAILRAAPDRLVFRLGERSSKLSRAYQKQLARPDEAKVRGIYRETAERIFRRGYDVVLMGHTHLPDDVTTVVGGRACRYLNTGDWVTHFSYVEFDGERFYTKTHPLRQL